MFNKLYYKLLSKLISEIDARRQLQEKLSQAELNNKITYTEYAKEQARTYCAYCEIRAKHCADPRSMHKCYCTFCFRGK